MSVKNQLAQLYIMGAMFGSFGQDSDKTYIDAEDIDIKPKKEIIPKGCLRYYFDKGGRCRTTDENINSVYDTVASSAKSAKKKFNNWYKSINYGKEL